MFSPYKTPVNPSCQSPLPLLGDADDTASRAGAGVAGLQGLLIATLAEVISAGVDDNGALEEQRTLAITVWHRTGCEGRTPMTLSGPISLTNLSLTVPLELP